MVYQHGGSSEAVHDAEMTDSQAQVAIQFIAQGLAQGGSFSELIECGPHLALRIRGKTGDDPPDLGGEL